MKKKKQHKCKKYKVAVKEEVHKPSFYIHEAWSTVLMSGLYNNYSYKSVFQTQIDEEKETA